jgi:type II secretory pathway pseudopilin PulG
MMQQSQAQIREPAADPESGYILLVVIFMTVIVLISLAIAAPKIAMSIQRDKELETIHRGEQYKRALKLYYQKFGSYPTSIDQLVETNQLRFLRKKYTDPLTGKADWKPILFGQAHVRPLGFFGQPLMTAGGLTGGASMYAVAASTTTDANGVPIASPNQSNTPGGLSGSSGSSFGSSSGFGSSSPSSGFGSSGSSLGSSSTGFGSQNGSSGTFGSSSSPTSGFGSSSGSNGSGTSATTFGGGGPIVGFTLPVDKPSLVLYKQQTRYNKWEFNYDPMEDQAQALSGLAGGTPPSTTNPSSTNGLTPGTTSPGSLPSNPTAPTTPPTAPTDPTAPQ